jgi:membrane-associated phospholipid phosphatase
VRYVPVGCAAVFGLAFAALTVAVVEDPGPLPGDRRVLLELHDMVGDSLDDPLVWLADLTDLVPLAVVAALVALGMAWRRQWRALVAGGIVVGVVWALNPVLKDLIERGRPDLWPHPMTVSEYSFPSGHAANTAALAAALAMIAWSSRLRTAAVVAGAVVVLLVALGQLALGLHYPSDILAGWLWAGAWAALVWWVLPPPWSVKPPPAPSGPPPTR